MSSEARAPSAEEARGLSHADLRTIYDRYGPLLRRRCIVFLRSPSLADDAMQEAFLKLLRIGASYKEATEPLRFLYRLTDNTCLDLLRRGKRLRTAEPLDQVTLVHPSTDPTDRKAALEVLAELDSESATIAILAFVDGLTQEEIANEIGVSRVTVNKRIARIRETFRPSRSEGAS